MWHLLLPIFKVFNHNKTKQKEVNMYLKSVATLLIASSTIFSSTAKAECSSELSMPKSNICVEIQWSYGPYLNQYNEAIVTLNPLKSDQEIKTQKIKIFPWMVMPNHQHGSRPVVIQKLRDHEFKVEKIYFMGGMMGYWLIKVQNLTSDNTLFEEVSYRVNF